MSEPTLAYVACPVCERSAAAHMKRIDDFVNACTCGTHFSAVTGYPIVDSVTHCKRCRALVQRNSLIDGYGVQCGCASKAYRELLKFAKDNRWFDGEKQ